MDVTKHRPIYLVTGSWDPLYITAPKSKLPRKNVLSQCEENKSPLLIARESNGCCIWTGLLTSHHRLLRLPGFPVAFGTRSALQWRDRAGFAPASLYGLSASIRKYAIKKALCAGKETRRDRSYSPSLSLVGHTETSHRQVS